LIRLQVTDIYYSFFKSFEASWADFSKINPFPQAGLVVNVPAAQENAVTLVGLTKAD
jgi:hypothetical protein